MKEEIELRSGRVISPNCGILGLERYDEQWRVTEGYDNVADYDSGWHGDDGSRLTPDERSEIATLMVGRWLEWESQR